MTTEGVILCYYTPSTNQRIYSLCTKQRFVTDRSVMLDFVCNLTERSPYLSGKTFRTLPSGQEPQGAE